MWGLPSYNFPRRGIIICVLEPGDRRHCWLYAVEMVNITVWALYRCASPVSHGPRWQWQAPTACMCAAVWVAGHGPPPPREARVSRGCFSRHELAAIVDAPPGPRRGQSLSSCPAPQCPHGPGPAVQRAGAACPWPRGGKDQSATAAAASSPLRQERRRLRGLQARPDPRGVRPGTWRGAVRTSPAPHHATRPGPAPPRWRPERRRLYGADLLSSHQPPRRAQHPHPRPSVSPLPSLPLPAGGGSGGSSSCLRWGAAARRCEDPPPEPPPPPVSQGGSERARLPRPLHTRSTVSRPAPSAVPSPPGRPARGLPVRRELQLLSAGWAAGGLSPTRPTPS